MTLLVRAPRKPDVVTSSTLGEEIRSVDDLTKPFQADVERITRETRQNEKALKLVTIEVAVDQTKTPDSKFREVNEQFEALNAFKAGQEDESIGINASILVLQRKRDLPAVLNRLHAVEDTLSAAKNNTPQSKRKAGDAGLNDNNESQRAEGARMRKAREETRIPALEKRDLKGKGAAAFQGNAKAAGSSKQIDSTFELDLDF
ncbi:hypothetical protein DL546_001393 [Coniochaeta pulveracea]|uniref:Uncharacterized protein n=1 Tax=Coniochaeta pulveracea TaxID=177199 RepID=A0A420Y9H3_9PEZI|nr:hypothetical protein DL546_001393 [Coniochaeta pulveracea]